MLKRTVGRRTIGSAKRAERRRHESVKGSTPTGGNTRTHGGLASKRGPLWYCTRVRGFTPPPRRKLIY